MFVNNYFTYLTCTYHKKQKVLYCEIFHILFLYDVEDIGRFSNLYQCTFKLEASVHVMCNSRLLFNTKNSSNDISCNLILKIPLGKWDLQMTSQVRSNYFSWKYLLVCNYLLEMSISTPATKFKFGAWRYDTEGDTTFFSFSDFYLLELILFFIQLFGISSPNNVLELLLKLSRVKKKIKKQFWKQKIVFK